MTAAPDGTNPGPLLAHAVREPGRGPGEETVLLFNGGMMTGAAWEPVAGRIARRFRVVTFDFRGQLLSPEAGRPTEDLDDHVADTVRLLDHLGLSRVHAVGTSFGAAVALLLAVRHPERVRSLVLVTATDRVTEEMRRSSRELQAAAREIAAGAPRDRFHDLLVAEVYSPGYRRAQGAELAERRRRLGLLPGSWFAGVGRILEAFLGADLEGAAEGVRCPTLVVAAAGDRVLPPERSRALAEAIDGAQLVEHPESGHALVAEDPEWLAEVCLEFLSARGKAQGPTPAAAPATEAGRSGREGAGRGGRGRGEDR